MLNEWKAIPGTIQKIVSFITNLNTTRLGEAALATAGRMSENSVIKQLSDALPANMTKTISDYVLALESGGLEKTIQDMLNTVSMSSSISVDI